MATRTLGMVGVLVGSVGVMGASTTALKPLDPVALQATVEAMAEAPAAGRHGSAAYPQGDFVFGYGATSNQPDRLAYGLPTANSIMLQMLDQI